MAQITKRNTASGESRYDVRTRIRGADVVTRTFKRRKDADSYATTIEADRLRGVAIDPMRAKITLRKYADANLAGRTHWRSGQPTFTAGSSTSRSTRRSVTRHWRS